ncbi:DotI/IcmL family type IV secretion protein [Legionella rowbothamii]|uniref:DotI/IcmL family type IV secretion protein n=1 Tax=Legionella rowbothamii TaxID=96229 RepID=UPI001055363A|nr:DotI/IcmL family type IV secretion protein [Legionella rowbothamii]
MKKTILWSALATLISAQVYAADPTTPATPPTATPTEPSKLPAAPGGQVTPAPAPSAVIDCNYKIPAQVKTVEQSVVLAWSQKAVIQAFSFDPNTLDAQMQQLQACFTEQGWTGFSSALKKSGNVEAIKSQSLKVSSHVDGQGFITDAKDNQWKVTLPLVVVYQNEKEKVSQLLSIDLTVNRKPTGDLGITQMIATPRGTVTTKKPVLINNPENTNLDTRPPADNTSNAPQNQPVTDKPQ